MKQRLSIDERDWTVFGGISRFGKMRVDKLEQELERLREAIAVGVEAAETDWGGKEFRLPGDVWSRIVLAAQSEASATKREGEE